MRRRMQETSETSVANIKNGGSNVNNKIPQRKRFCANLPLQPGKHQSNLINSQTGNC